MMLTLNGRWWYDFAGAEYFFVEYLQISLPLHLLLSVPKTPTHMPPHARTHAWSSHTHTRMHRCDQTCKQADIYQAPRSYPCSHTHLTLSRRTWMVSTSLHFEQNQAADRWMDGGGIRHPVPSSPHFLPNRYKLGMKSLAPCQFQSGTCSSCLPLRKLPPIPENRRNALPVTTGYTLTHRIASDTQSNYVCRLFVFVAAARYSSCVVIVSIFNPQLAVSCCAVLCFASLEFCRVRILMRGSTGPVGVIVQ